MPSTGPWKRTATRSPSAPRTAPSSSRGRRPASAWTRSPGDWPKLGLGRGDTIALLLSNRPEFHLVDLAAITLGATPFSIYNTYSPEQIEYVVADAEAQIAVTEPGLVDNLLAAREDLDALEHVILVEGDRPGTAGEAAGQGCLSLEEVEG